MKYRKKPIVVEAEVYRFGLEDGVECSYKGSCNKCLTCRTCVYFPPYIDTLEGRMYISPGDFIITGVNGERYPCKPDIFHKTYEEVIKDGN